MRSSDWSSDVCSSDLEGPTSRVTQIRPDGTRKVLLQDEIMLSNGIAVGPDGMLYVSTGSQLAGAGAVIKLDPGAAGDPAAAPAYTPDHLPRPNFDDVGANHHRAAHTEAHPSGKESSQQR